MIPSPPGNGIGLAHNQRVTLRVRYESERGEPIAGASIAFAMTATQTGEAAAGSTLSADSTVTDSLGMARVELAAGAQDTDFRVLVDAADAPTATFFISVREGGFTELRVTPVHSGWLPASTFAQIEARLYRTSELQCSQLDIDAPPMSLFPPRDLDGFGGAVRFETAAAGVAHTVIAWTLAADSAVPLSVGCADIGASAVPGGVVRLELVVADREPVIADDTPVAARYGLGPLRAALDAAGTETLWEALACPAGPGQVVLDCALDAHAPDGAADCAVGGSSPLIAAAEARRGPAGADGCRPELDGGGAPSLDQLLTDAIASGGTFPTGAALADVLAARDDALAAITLRSALTRVGDGAARHRLATAEIAVAGDPFTLDLAATSRPVIEQPQVGFAFANGAMTLAPHGFTLRLGAIAAAAFDAGGLEPAGLGGGGNALGAALTGSALGPGGEPGCAGASAVVCGELGEPAGCLTAACDAAAPVIDASLAAGMELASGDGLDFFAACTVTVFDADRDVIVDPGGVGVDPSGVPHGVWQATATLADGAPISLTGSPAP